MSERFSVKDKGILVTGASSGIGQHLARMLAGEGARVVLAARRREQLQTLCDEIRATGQEAHWAIIDVNDPEQVQTGVKESANVLNGLDVVINNSGIARTVPALKSSDSDFDDVLNTNLRGAWLVARASGQLMAESGGGVIVNTASILAYRVINGLAAYAASKAALKSLTESLALEWARHDIRVNAIAPGYIRTEINSEFFDTPEGKKVIDRIPQRRLGDLTDLDGAVLLLASEASRFMTGSTIVIDGGHMQAGL